MSNYMYGEEVAKLIDSINNAKPGSIHPIPSNYVQVVRDVVNSPAHYNRYGVECITAIKASMSDQEFRGYLKGNCEKYIWRYMYKGKPLEDLKKAEWYLNRLIQELQNENKTTPSK